MRGNTFLEESFIENDEVAFRKPTFQVSVIGEVVVKHFETHVRISKRDWDKFSPQIIAVLKQGDRKHETGSKESSSACG